MGEDLRQPLTRAQLALWIVQETQPGIAVNVAQYMDLRGPLDHELFMLTGVELGHWQQMLFTRYEHTANGPVMLIDHSLRDRPHYFDLRTDADPIAKALQWMEDDYTRPIDPTRDRTAEAVLFQIADDRHFFYERGHHLSWDGASATSLRNKQAARYTALQKGASEPLPPPPDLSVPDRADADYRSSRRFNTDREYWLGELEGLAKATVLAARPGPPHPVSHRITGAVPLSTGKRIKAVEASQRTTLPAIVAAAIAAYVARLRNVDDITLSLPVAARTTAALRDTPLPVSNVLPIRTRVSPKSTVSEALVTTQTALIGALRHQRYRFEDIRHDAASRRDGDSALSLTGYGGPPINLMLFDRTMKFGECTGTFHVLTTGPVDDIAFSLYYSGEIAPENLRFDVQANPNRYTLAEAEAIHRQILAVFETYADALDTEPESLVSSLPLLDEAVEETLPSPAGFVQRPRASRSAGLTVVDRIMDAAQRYPEQPAIIFDGNVLDFRELTDRARALAGELQRHGVGPNSRVAVMVPRSDFTMIAQLAVLMCGAAYVPIDPEYPAARVAMVLEDSSPLVVVVTELLLEVPDAMQVRADCNYPLTSWTPPRIDPSDLAYIIYTSGSTGRPKGVAVNHRALSAMLDACDAIYEPDVGDVFSCTHSTAFDFSVFEIFLPWAAGAAVLMVDNDTARDPQRLWATVLANQVSVLSQTPSAFAPLAEVAAISNDSGVLRHVVFGGEALYPGVLATWNSAFGDRVALTNMYGLTEATVHVTATSVRHSDSRSLIGGAIGELRVDVLDDELRSTPIGEWGELYVAGTQLAQGYWGNTALTASRFIAAAGGRRMYRTGDIVRRTDDGNIEYRGRADNQVQLRGYRIELDEVAAVLRSAPGVADAVATVHNGDRAGGGDLVGYVLGVALDSSAVRAWCASRLPDFEVPAQVGVVEHFPLTPSGKVDVAALPAIERIVVAGNNETDPMLNIVVAAIADELGVDPQTIDPAASVFASGVNSLGAMSISLALGRSTGHPVSVRALVQAPDLYAVARKLRLGTPQGTDKESIPKRAGEERIPLTPQQEALWLRWQLDPADISYNMSAAINVDDVPAEQLWGAVRWLVQRHEALRTTFSQDDTGPYQVVRAGDDLELDLTPVPTSDLPGALDQLARSFDLSVELPWRAAVFTVDGQRWLGVVLHHIAVDGHSVRLIQDDLERYLSGVVDESERSIGYPDYALWQHGSEPAVLEHFWQDVFADTPAPLRLPEVHPRTPGDRETGHATAAIGAADYRRLTDFAAWSRTTPFITVHTALATLLSRQSGNADIVIGTATSGRNHPELTDVVGMFARTVPLRTQIDLEKSFSAVVADVTNRDLDAFAHADISPLRLAQIVDPHRHAADAQIFDVFLADTDASATPAGAYVTPPHARFGLDFSMNRAPDGSGLELQLHYAVGVIDENRAQSLVDGVFDLLQRAVSAPDVPMFTHLLGAGERDLAVSPPSLATMYDLMAGSATRFPDAIALEDTDTGTVLQYHELDGASTSIARELISHNVGTGDVVAIGTGRSAASIVAMWAVLKTGAAFVQLNPADPHTRNELIVQQAGVTVGVHAGHAPGDGFGVPWINARPPTSTVAVQPFSTEERVRPVRLDDVVYVTFTSGTTGTPKGVMVTHRGIAPFVRAVAERVGLRQDSRVLHNYNVTFDAHLIELIPTFNAGATVVVCPPHIVAGTELRDLIIEQSISVFFSTPSVLATIDADTVPGLETVIVGGEALPHHLAVEWSARTRLVNFYGPTEATVAATGDAPVDSARPITIGTGLPGMATLILDGRLRPVQNNTVGELYLAGPGVALGYIGDSAATAHRFIANPFSEPGLRMYRTGDLVHRRDDGRMVIHGRADDQLKLRGMRLEPDEINTALRDVDGVRGAHTGLATSTSGEDLLVSWVTGDVDGDSVRRSLREVLPARFIPSSVLVIGEFPVTASGKIDRKALPSPWSNSSTVTAPRTPTELLIAKVFADVIGIGVEQIGVHSDFFDLGGSSLAATRAASRLTEHTGRTVMVRSLFESRTVADLAVEIDALDSAEESVVPVHLPDAVDLPLSYSQRRMWILNRLDPTSTAYTVPVVLRITGTLDVEALLSAVTELGRRHESLRTVYPETPAGPYQRVLSPDSVPTTRYRRVETTSVGDLETELVSAPFDLTTHPAFRSELIEIADKHEFLLVIVMHHVAIDGWSMRTLLTDLVQNYLLGTGRAAPSQLTYGDYTVWQSKWLGDPEIPDSRFRRQLDFWQTTLDGAGDPIELPRVEGTPRFGGRQHADIDDEVLAGLTRLSVRESATVFHVAHAALAALLSYATGRDDLVVGTPVLGRSHPAWESVVGMFVNTIALRTRIDAEASISQVLRATRDVDLSAVDHSDVPYDAVARAARPDHRGGGDPLISVLLVEQDYESMLDPALGLDVPGVQIELLTRQDALVGAKFDLEVVLTHQPGRPFTVTMIRAAHVSADFVDSLLHAYVAMLSAAATNADRPFPTPELATTSGSVSKAVAAPAVAQPADHTVALEVAAAMATTLGVPAESVRLGDDFFALGGSSLSATQVTALLGQRLGLTIPVHLLFEAATPFALAAAIRDADAGSSSELPPLTGPGAVAVPDPLPLAPTQRRLWVVQQMAPTSTMYLIPVLVPVPGHVPDAEVLDAVQFVVDRHAPLRTSYPNSPSGPVQHVHEQHTVELSLVDVDGMDPGSFVREQLSTPLDLELEIPARWSLLWDSAGNRAVLLIAHHIAVDGSSARIITQDLAAALDGARAEPLRVDYAQVTKWQLAAHELVGDRQRAFWAAQLAGYSGILDLTPERPAVRSSATAQTAVEVSPAISAAIAAVTARVGVTEFHVLHAALALTLSIQAGTDDIAIGTPGSLRHHVETADMVGMFVSTIVLRTVIKPGLSTEDLLHLVRRTDLDALDNALVPFDDVVALVDPPRDPGRHPLVQVALSYLAESTAVSAMGSASAGVIGSPDSEFDLQLTVGRSDSGLYAVFTYATDLFDATVIETIARRWELALESIATPAPASLDLIDLRLETERQLVSEPRKRSRRTLGEIFAATARAHPSAVAIESSSGSMTYRELDEWTSRIATHLRNSGVRRGGRVAAVLPRSMDSVAMFWGAVKAGAVYVPIDPHYPAERAERMLRRVDADLVIREGGVPTSSAVIDRGTDLLPEATSSLEDAVAILFTSGTLGQPNAVALTHRGMEKFTDGSVFDIHVNDRVAHAASISFDAAIFEMLLAVGPGATLSIVDPDVSGGPGATAELAARQATWMFATPSVLATLDESKLPDLRGIVIGGEPCTGELVRRWAPGRRLINGYGPTETTMCVTVHELTPGRPILIGNPLDDVVTEVVDTHMRPVPDGVAGELYLGGPALAQGYVNDNSLTAVRFVAGPDGGRWYRTGDLVRRTNEGLHYLGRIDHQVKIRGQRIEPAEIDLALMSAGAEYAATVVIERPTGSVLVSYVVGVDEDDVRRLRAHCVATLPSAMVPARIVVVGELPRTGAGKLDTSRLPAPDWDSQVGGQPDTELEHLIVRAFRDHLETDAVGVDDDFFVSGGDSLLATRVAAALEEQLGRRVPVRTFFEQPTPRGLAQLLERLPRLDSRVLPALGSIPDEGDVPLAPNQRRLWYVHEMLSGSSLYTVPIYVPVPAEVGDAAIVPAVETLIRRHAPLRTSYPATPAGPRQLVHNNFSARVWHVTEDEHAARVTFDEVSAPFDLQTEPPVRVVLLHHAHGRGVLFVIHHIAVDGDSANVITADLTALLRGEQLRPLTVEYPQVARWQAAVNAELREEQLQFWTHTLAGYSGVLDLVPDRPRMRSLATASLTTDADSAVVGRIPGIVDRLSVTEFHVIHAALALALSIQGGTDDVAVGTPASMRRHVEVTDLVGMFVSTVVLRTVLRPGMTSHDLMTAVRDADVAALDNAFVPFDEVVAEIDPPRDPGRHPLVQIALSFSAAQSTSNVGLPSPDSEFDLQVTVVRGPGGLGVTFTYGAALFSSAQIVEFARVFHAALDLVTAATPKSLDRFDIRTIEQQEIKPIRTGSPVRTLGEIFRSAVTANPDGIAVSDGVRTLTYQQLDDWAAVVAQTLTGTGVRPGDRVAMMIPRSVESIVALWAIVRVGAVYVPVDPAYPSSRIHRMLEVSRVTTVLSMDTLMPQPIDPVTRVDYALVSPDASAYLLFTSGTTGAPNGVAVTHRGLSKFTDGSVLDIGQDDRVAHAASISFDASLFEVLLAVGPGATLEIIDAGSVAGRAATEHLAARQITWMFTTPTVLATLDEGRLHGVRGIVVGGEPLSPDLASQWARGRQLINGYGPTEVSMCATMFHCDVDGPVLIGSPLDDVTATVLDTHLRPVPDGVAGELYLSGAALAEGYWRNATLTASRFVAGPQGSRLYRTGDLVRRTSLGIEYLGRTDRQVKIRGQRVELAEIDSVLMAAGAHQAVTVVAGEPSQPRLVSYVIADQSNSNAQQLRDRCEQVLPHHMIPSSIMIVESLPRTPAGKLDTDALPEPAREVAAGGEPRTPTEKAVVDIFRDVLDNNDIGVHDSFFDVGGNSLLLLEIARGVTERLGVPAPVATLFDHPSPAMLSAAIDSARDLSESLGQILPLSGTGDVDGPTLWCVHPASGLAADYRPLAQAIEPMVVFGLQMPGLADPKAPTVSSVEELAARHIEAVLTVQPEGPYRLLGWSLGGVLAHEMASQMSSRDMDVELLVLLDTNPIVDESSEAVEAAIALDQELAAALRRIDPVLFDDYQRRRTTLLHAAAAYRPKPIEVGTAVYIAAQDNEEISRWENVSGTPLVFERVGYDHADLGNPKAMHEIAERLGSLIPDMFTYSEGDR
ncbi:amino acid adenylation domain-containing protein [Williamsia muralis]|uniref:non-ribosomal peptide synthetase n=1 Tax=Williamsia marianensis TaxID=85044 RepID=UPI003F15ADCF